jgi:hypothetical protein
MLCSAASSLAGRLDSDEDDVHLVATSVRSEEVFSKKDRIGLSWGMRLSERQWETESIYETGCFSNSTLPGSAS